MAHTQRFWMVLDVIKVDAGESGRERIGWLAGGELALAGGGWFICVSGRWVANRRFEHGGNVLLCTHLESWLRVDFHPPG